MAALVVTGAVGLTACGNDEEPEPQAEQNNQDEQPDEPEETPSETPGPTPSIPEDAQEYVTVALEYYEVYNDARETGDVSRLRELSLSECSECSLGIDNIEETYANGGHFENGGLYPDPDTDIEPTKIGEDHAKVVMTYESRSGTWVKEKGADPETGESELQEKEITLEKGDGEWRVKDIITEPVDE